MDITLCGGWDVRAFASEKKLLFYDFQVTTFNLYLIVAYNNTRKYLLLQMFGLTLYICLCQFEIQMTTTLFINSGVNVLQANEQSHS